MKDSNQIPVDDVSVFRWAMTWAVIGGVIGALLVAAKIWLNIGGSLATGIRWIDSMLYSDGGPWALSVIACIWAACGSLIGGAVGAVIGMSRQRFN